MQLHALRGMVQPADKCSNGRAAAGVSGGLASAHLCGCGDRGALESRLLWLCCRSRSGSCKCRWRSSAA